MIIFYINIILVCIGVIPLKNSPQPYMLNKKKELSYRIHLKFNISDTQISWKGYLIGSLTPKINIHLMSYKKKQTVRRCLPSKILLSLSI